MMAEPVLIDDDDVVMVEDSLSKDPVVIVDEDDVTISNEKTLSAPTVSTEDTIVLDDETPILTGTPMKIMNKETEKCFVNFLENNRLMDKIVTRCTTMENATGMPRVVYKTLLPLYKDTNNRFKESDSFREMLKRTYRLLMKDPDHKFLHIKTLCEELKSGGLRRKVPFVTLGSKLTTLHTDSKQSDCIESTNSSNEINQNVTKDVEIRAIPKINRRNYTTPKRFGGKAKKRKFSKRERVQTRSVTQSEKPDIIDLDDSETESADSVGSQIDDGQNDVIIVEEKEPSDQRNNNPNTLPQETLGVPEDSNKVLQVTLPKDSNKENNVIQDNLEKDSNKMVQETVALTCYSHTKVTQSTLAVDSNKQNKLIQAGSVIVYNKQSKVIKTTSETDSNGQNKVEQETLAIDADRRNKVMHESLAIDYDRRNKVMQGTLALDSDRRNNVIQELLALDSDRRNKVLQEKLARDADSRKKMHNSDRQNEVIQETEENEMDYDLLIPKTRLQVLPSAMTDIEPETVEFLSDLPNDEEIEQLEKHIAYCKERIDLLEKEEVTTNSHLGSQYLLCSKYKEELVTCYKQICELSGKSQEIVKRRQIRLQVTEGHPPGPAKRLEDSLNRTIDGTGAVAFPDFSDVLKCVVEANLADNLAWNKHQIMQEAVALFRQCGQALRKRRQKREYKDLLGLVRDKETIDDPAEKDPLLLAKLKENKRIAIAKEEQILDSYVAMEQNPSQQYTVRFVSEKDSSDAECEREQTITAMGESSISNVNLLYLIPNNVNVSSSMTINNNSNVGQSSNTNNVIANNLVATPTPATQNPLLLGYLITAPRNPNFVSNNIQTMITNENQCPIQETHIISDDNSMDLDVADINTRSSTPYSISECETTDSSDEDEKVDPETELTITETTVGFNTASDLISSSRNNIENTDPAANNRECNVSSTTDGVEQNCDSSISPESVVKSEPLDIQNMLDELGDDFVCQVFDIEDPFLVIEISSDESTDDEEL